MQKSWLQGAADAEVIINSYYQVFANPMLAQ